MAAASSPDGIAIDPVDSLENLQEIQNIKTRGIPVILFDAPPAGTGITTIGNDFAEQGAIAARR